MVYFECNITFALLQLFSTEKGKMRVFMILELKKEKNPKQENLGFYWLNSIEIQKNNVPNIAR